MKYPSLEEVNSASHIDICKWWRFLPSPGINYIDSPNFEKILSNEVDIMNRIAERLKYFGGFTSKISKTISWSE